MVHRRRDPYCFFPSGGEPAYSVWYQIANDRGDVIPARLCWRHHRILRLAGERGRVYKPTGERWRLVVR
jgi:hypothetical protein